MSWTLSRTLIALRDRAQWAWHRVRTEEDGGVQTSEWVTLIAVVLGIVAAVAVIITAGLLAKANGVFG